MLRATCPDTCRRPTGGAGILRGSQPWVPDIRLRRIPEWQHDEREIPEWQRCHSGRSAKRAEPGPRARGWTLAFPALGGDNGQADPHSRSGYLDPPCEQQRAGSHPASFPNLRPFTVP